MKAIVITEFGPAAGLQLREVPYPTPGPGEVLIKVAAAGVNRPDVAQRQGKYPAPAGAPADIPGLEVSGTVEIADPQSYFNPGDQVCALLAGGGYAEKVVAPAQLCLKIPDGLTLEESAALPETFFTVWNNIFHIGKFKKDTAVLVHGGTSGIGVAAIQMVTAMGGKVYTTAGSAEKCQYCLELGAAEAINYREQDFATVLGKNKVDLILDMVGGSYLNKNIHIAKPGGKIIQINSMQARMAEVDLLKLMTKQLVLTGSTLRSQNVEYKAMLAQGLLENIWPLIGQGKIKPVICKRFPLAQAAAAHELMESSRHIGKILLVPGDEKVS